MSKTCEQCNGTGEVGLGNKCLCCSGCGRLTADSPVIARLRTSVLNDIESLAEFVAAGPSRADQMEADIRDIYRRRNFSLNLDSPEYALERLRFLFDSDILKNSPS